MYGFLTGNRLSSKNVDRRQTERSLAMSVLHHRTLLRMPGLDFPKIRPHLVVVEPSNWHAHPMR